MLSINFSRGPSLFGAADAFETSPGWKTSAMAIAIMADTIDVVAKYVIVLTVIRPLTLGLMLAETVTKHDKSNGNVKNFKIRKKISPG